MREEERKKDGKKDGKKERRKRLGQTTQVDSYSGKKDFSGHS